MTALTCLSPRLRAVALEIASHGTHDILYDIGTDHAHLPICLVGVGICAAVAAADVREGPLAKARANVGAAGLSARISLALGDGFSAFADYRPGRYVVLAGIGAKNLTEIVERGIERAKAAATLIFQPMNNQELLREYLVGRGFHINHERLAAEERRIYSVLVCRWSGVRETYAPEEYYIGRRLVGSADEIAHFYRFTRKKIMNRCRGLRAILDGRGGGQPDGAGRSAAETEMERLTAVLRAIDSRLAHGT